MWMDSGPEVRDGSILNVSREFIALYPCSNKTREILGNPSPTPKRFPETLEISRGKSQGRRGWICQYLSSFGGVLTFYHHQRIMKGLTVLKSILPCCWWKNYLYQGLLWPQTLNQCSLKAMFQQSTEFDKLSHRKSITYEDKKHEISELPQYVAMNLCTLLDPSWCLELSYCSMKHSIRR